MSKSIKNIVPLSYSSISTSTADLGKTSQSKAIEEKKFKKIFGASKKQLQRFRKSNSFETVFNRFDIFVYQILSSNNNFVKISDIRDSIRFGEFRVNGHVERRASRILQASDFISGNFSKLQQLKKKPFINFFAIDRSKLL